MNARSATGPSGAVTIFVCQTCGAEQHPALAGEKVLATLQAANSEPENITITGVDCLAVCEHPVTISFAATGKWTYLVGNVDTNTPTHDIFAAAKAVAASPHGVPDMAARPPFFRDGVVARTPPAGWSWPQ